MNCIKKVVYGQFFTRDSIWLKRQIEEFILNTNTTIAYDPFAGAGDLLNVAKRLGYSNIKGLDIDTCLSWDINDSLLNIPRLDNAIIITNPPYISNYSAARKGLNNNFVQYFAKSSYDDVYMIALDKMLDAADYIVAIIPETFINLNYCKKHRLQSITILEDNPFCDTDTPVIVACFDNRIKSLDEVAVYKNDRYINSLGAIERMRLLPSKTINMVFNDKNGWLAVRCVDTTNPREMLKFDFKRNINYDWDKGIKTSSRLLTLIQVDVKNEQQQDLINSCNCILNSLRDKTDDIIFSPFKGNMKNGKRRRRLDFLTCRAIVEKAYSQVVRPKTGDLFNYD